jgi:hypothetical protein
LDLLASDRAGRAGHQQLVVAAVLVPHRGGHRERDRPIIQCAPGRRAPDPPTAPHGREAGDRCGPLARAAREQPRHRLGQLALEHQVLVGAALPVAFTATGARVLVGQALHLGLLQGRLLNQDPLALVALARAAEPDDHRHQTACLPGAPAQGGVAGRQEDKVVQVRASHAEWPAILHEQQRARAAAAGARPLVERLDDHQVGSLGLRPDDAALEPGPRLATGDGLLRHDGEDSASIARQAWAFVAGRQRPSALLGAGDALTVEGGSISHMPSHPVRPDTDGSHLNGIMGV